MWPVVYTSTQAGLPTMSHIDSANQEVCAQPLRLHYGVNTLRRLPIYVHTMFTLRKLLLAATVHKSSIVHTNIFVYQESPFQLGVVPSAAILD